MANDVVVRRIATAVALACAAVVVVTAAAAVFPSLRSRLGLVPTRAPSYRVGDRIDVPKGIYDRSPRTLLVFIRSSCAACQAAKPALKKIADTFRQTATPVIVITAGARASADSTYAAELGLEPSQVEALDLSALRLQVVPTLVLVDRSGEVLYAAEGVLSDQEEQQLLRLASSLPPRG